MFIYDVISVFSPILFSERYINKLSWAQWTKSKVPLSPHWGQSHVLAIVTTQGFKKQSFGPLAVTDSNYNFLQM